MVDGELVRLAQADYDESLGGEQVELVELMATDGLGNSTMTTINVTIDNDPTDDDTTDDDTTEITQLIGNHGDNLLRGTAEDELIDGRGGSDRLIGRGGDDMLLGGLGKDRLVGGSGADFLNGGLGRDILRGGADEDEFFFDTSGADNFDRIVGFEIGIDTIVLDGATFGISSESFSDVFALGTIATDVDDRILYDSSRGRLFYDADGSGDGAAELIARLGRGFELTVTDFEIA
jgi:Ca2+-binding RTX toxin-like protein